MTDARTCPRCGKQVFTADGACASCALRGALDPGPPPEELPGTRFGPYELLGTVARGGMGIVYRARDTRTGRVVALKMLLTGGAGDADELRRFQEEIRNAQQLEHPNIVPIYEAGELDDTPYFTMPLLTGGNLEQQLPALSADRRRACALLVTIAEAAHFAHQRHIVHRDLKPSNVLFDGATPKIADFGTAKNLAASRAPTASGTVLGTPGYMAPEQVRGDASRVQPSADVYALGAILYEVLTGRPPFTAETWERTLQQVLSDAEPVRPRRLDPTVDRDLETICLACLEKDPSLRYPSAHALAEDLNNYLEGRSLVRDPPSAFVRTLRWGRRNAGASAVFIAVAVFAAVASSSALGTARGQAEVLRERVLAAESHAARMAAGAVQFQLREYGDRVRRAAEDPNYVRLLETDDREALLDAGKPKALEPAGGEGHFDSWLIDNNESIEVAHWPGAAPGFHVLGRDFGFRNYFQGARALGLAGHRDVYVSRAFRTEADGKMKFFFSAPMFGSDGGMVGITAASVPTGSVLGRATISGDGVVAALISPRDRSRQEANAWLPTDFVYLVHDGIPSGDQVLRSDAGSFNDSDKRGLREVYHLSPGCWTVRGTPDHRCVVTDADFRDDVAGYEGRWLAALAPVAGSRFVVVVQTRDDVALRPGHLLRDSLLNNGVPTLLGSTLLGVALFLALRRRL